MNRPCQLCCRTTVIFAAAQLAVFSLSAQTAVSVLPPGKISAAVTNIMPPVPQFRSPVDFFRNLLAMSSRDRNNFLCTNKPPEVRGAQIPRARFMRISCA